MREVRDKKTTRPLNVPKATLVVVLTNALQILLVLVLAIIFYFRPQDTMTIDVFRGMIIVAAVLIIYLSVVAIRDAYHDLRVQKQFDALEQAAQHEEALTRKMRAQRHDFLNHLQVVYSLMEMQEYSEAQDYIDKVYGDIKALSKILITKNQAVNALLQVKLAECKKRDINAELNVKTQLADVPMPGWEVCRVLANLIDNAMDALDERENDKRLYISVWEEAGAYCLRVRNNGPMIPEKNQQKIFEPGITTKAMGHGMGLSIVKETLAKYNGTISLASIPDETAFSVKIPKDLKRMSE
ncbi:MAG: Spo0B domain-containing protein [Eubacteriales bacterium]|nr:Spo0B domain-containing protein [Eubacteriales bacterium]MDD3882934.1 Spo0B domain-containing protein [Eubacteriales bacterium]MDD4513519.1 Spo0B domain-containing protein [Eubacteriales bacterium]